MSDEISPHEIKAGKAVIKGSVRQVIHELQEIIDVLEPQLAPEVIEELRDALRELEEEP